MTDADEPDRDRMRREEDDYHAVKDKPPRPIAEVAAAVLAKVGIAKPVDEPLYPRRTLDNRRGDAAWIIAKHPEYSDRRIARIVGVGRELIGSMRRDLISQGLIAERHCLHRVGADGKTYTRLPRKTKERIR